MYLTSDTMQYKTLAKRLFSDMKIKYLQMMNIDVHTILQGFQETHMSHKENDVHTKDFSLKIAVSLNLLSTLFHRLGSS